MFSAGYGTVKLPVKGEGPAEPIQEHSETVPSGALISAGCSFPWNRIGRILMPLHAAMPCFPTVARALLCTIPYLVKAFRALPKLPPRYNTAPTRRLSPLRFRSLYRRNIGTKPLLSV